MTRTRKDLPTESKEEKEERRAYRRRRAEERAKAENLKEYLLTAFIKKFDDDERTDP